MQTLAFCQNEEIMQYLKITLQASNQYISDTDYPPHFSKTIARITAASAKMVVHRKYYPNWTVKSIWFEFQIKSFEITKFLKECRNQVAKKNLIR